MRYKTILASLAIASNVQVSAQTIDYNLPAELGGGPEIPLTATDREAVKQLERWARKKRKLSVGNSGQVIYTYGNGVPSVLCRPLATCTITLQPGETVQSDTAVSVGDPLRWHVGLGVSGGGGGKPLTTHITVSPTDNNIRTNIKIFTDRRAYHLNLISSKRRAITHDVAFIYPADMLQNWKSYKRQVETVQRAQKSAMLNRPCLGAENTDYSVHGTARWSPIMVCDDGKQTYFVMPHYYQVAPALFVDDGNGKAGRVLNYRVKDHLYTADQTASRWVMVHGPDNERVTIVRHSDAITGRAARKTPVKHRSGFGSK